MSLVVFVTSSLSAGAGAFLGSYLKKKGENLATHEDVDKLVDQMKAVTQATKEIENKISSDLWDRQKRWELKREVIFDTSKAMMEMNNLLFQIGVILRVVTPKDNAPLDSNGARLIEEKIRPFLDLLNRFDGLRLLIAIVCDADTVIKIEAVSNLARDVISKIGNGNHGAYHASVPDLQFRINQVQHAFRKELGIPQDASIQ